MRIKHYTLIIAFLAISMGIPLVQGCSDPFDEYGNGGTEMPVRDGWTSVSMSKLSFILFFLRLLLFCKLILRYLVKC